MIRRNVPDNSVNLIREFEKVSLEEVAASNKRGSRTSKFVSSVVAFLIIGAIVFSFWPVISAEIFSIGGGVKWVSVFLIVLQLHSHWHTDGGDDYF